MVRVNFSRGRPIHRSAPSTWSKSANPATDIPQTFTHRWFCMYERRHHAFPPAPASNIAEVRVTRVSRIVLRASSPRSS